MVLFSSVSRPNEVPTRYIRQGIHMGNKRKLELSEAERSKIKERDILFIGVYEGDENSCIYDERVM